jgi:lambda repressor-like predicted transcriptional regulator
MAVGKEYWTPGARDYLLAAKVRASTVIRDKGYSIPELSRDTRIPLTTLTRWLDQETDSSIPIPAMAIIAEQLGINPIQLLPVDHQHVSLGRDLKLSRLLAAPENHLQALSDMYGVMMRVMRE